MLLTKNYNNVFEFVEVNTRNIANSSLRIQGKRHFDDVALKLAVLTSFLIAIVILYT